MPGPNSEQIAHWNVHSGPSWVRRQAALDAQIGPLGIAAIDLAAVAAGERTLDVGCGCGDATLELARRVGEAGSALGADVSRPMLERARERARETGLAGASFVEADVQVHPFETAAYDLVFSRFGVMFFEDPSAAFRNLRRALRSGGRLAFVCWQELARNDWVRVPVLAAAKHVPLPDPPAPGAPGPFSFADPDRIRSILHGAGFDAVRVEPHETDVVQGGGGGLDGTVELMLEVGPVAGILRQQPEARVAMAESLREALLPYARGDAIRMASAAWLVTAVNPG